MKRGQINQLFVWIVVALVIGATVLFGVRSIGGLLEDKCSVDLIQFEDTLANTIMLNNDFGSVNAQSIAMPCDYRIICMIDARSIDEQVSLQIKPEQVDVVRSFDTLMQSSVEDGVEENVFIANTDEMIPAGYIPQLRLNEERDVTPNAPECVEISSGRLELIMEGLGRNTFIREIN
jgi:hypothetical protein